jgi:membrane dipeptidase
VKTLSVSGSVKAARKSRAVTLARFAALAASVAVLFPRSLVAEESAPGVVDLHVDLPYRSFYKKAPFDLGSGQFSAERILQGGVRGVVLPLYVPLDADPHGRSRYQFEASYSHVFSHILKTAPYSLPGCAIERAGSETRSVSTWLAFEGSEPLGADESEIRKWIVRGVRVFGLVHSVPNTFAATSGPSGTPPPDFGLTPEGKKFVELVYKLGGVIDVSHASDRATDDALSIARRLGRPLIATHSNARALAPHPRNLSDAQIRGIAATGGVIGVNFHQPFLAAKRGQSAGLDEVVRQVQHLRQVGGIDVVAIGSDFEGGISPVPELSDASRFPRLHRSLRASGLSQAEVLQVFSKNALRVLCPSPVPSR